MASVFPGTKSVSNPLALPSGRALARGMSRHASVAMLVFALWQVWLALRFADSAGGGALPWVSLVLLMIGAIPFARHMERRWQRLTQDSFPCPGLVAAYRRDRRRLWLLAISAPVIALGATIMIGTLA
jgi:hypothetical protein